MVAREGLDRVGRAAVGVALAQDRVDGAALDPVIARADLALLVIGRLVRIVGDVVALRRSSAIAALSWGTEALMLGSLMMLASGVVGQLAELGQRVGDPLLLVEPIRELGQDPPRERDVAQLHLDPGAAAKAWTIGSSDWVASAGASSVWV